MATAKRRASRRRIEQIEFVSDSSLLADGSDAVNNQLFNIDESATIEHQETKMNLSKSTLTPIGHLRRGRFSENLILYEVKDHPGFKIAVMHSPLSHVAENPVRFRTYVDLHTIREIGSGENSHVTKFYAAILDRELFELMVCVEVCDAPMDRFARQMHAMKLIQDVDIFLKRLISHMVDALRFLKTKNVLHRDIRPSNIFIKRDPLCFKLCDFGIDEFMEGRHPMAVMNDNYYIAPEKMENNLPPGRYRIQSNMWSLGLSVLEMANGVHPFDRWNALRIFQLIKTWHPEFSTSLSRELTDLIESLLKIDPSARPVTYEEILSSPAMTSLPTEVTETEQNFVNQVVLNMPQIDNDED